MTPQRTVNAGYLVSGLGIIVLLLVVGRGGIRSARLRAGSRARRSGPERYGEVLKPHQLPDRTVWLTVVGAGHYGIFSGRRWRETVYPQVRDFIRRHAG